MNTVESGQQVGQQHYELFRLEDLSGWMLEPYSGAEGELRGSREQQMWGQYVAAPRRDLRLSSPKPDLWI